MLASQNKKKLKRPSAAKLKRYLPQPEPVKPPAPEIRVIEGTPGPAGSDGPAGTGIRALERVGRDLLVYLSDGQGYRVSEFVPDDGQDGIDGRDGLDGLPGHDGRDGTDGLDGRDGADAVGLEEVFIENRDLKVRTTDGNVENVGTVVTKSMRGPRGLPGKPGATGIKGKAAPRIVELSTDDGKLVANMSDGTKIVAGELPKGPAGVGIKDVEYKDKSLVVNMSDGATQEFDLKINEEGKTFDMDERHGRIRFKVKGRFTQWFYLFHGGGGGGGSTGDATGLPWYYIPSGTTVTVPENRQHLIKGQQVVDGEIIVLGESVIF
jgi:hypothetical protein